VDFSIAALLTQDGITNGAIYALLALALVLVFSVTRVIFVPQTGQVPFAMRRPLVSSTLPSKSRFSRHLTQ